MNNSTKTKGFSLIELMVVLAIIAILTAIAYPIYTKYVYRSRRTDATTALTSDVTIIERCYDNYFSYNNPSCPALPSTSPNGFYNLSSQITSTSYSITATATGPQASDINCSSLSINSAGQKTSTGGDPVNNCWGLN